MIVGMAYADFPSVCYSDPEPAPLRSVPLQPVTPRRIARFFVGAPPPATAADPSHHQRRLLENMRLAGFVEFLSKKIVDKYDLS